MTEDFFGKKRSNDKVPGKLIYPDLSYKIIGIVFKIFNQLGYGYQEKHYQRALATALDKEKLKFSREEEVKIKYDGQFIGKYYLDFIVENKIILELKVLPIFKSSNLRQTSEYLNATSLKLALLIYFTPKGIKYRRIINPNITI